MSSYYGIVFPEFWTGDTGRAIQANGGKDAQILALYLMSCRHATMIGLYALAVRDVRHETGLSSKAFVRACASLADVRFAEYDAGTEHVWVHEMAKFRLGLQKKSPLDADDNRVAGVQRLYDRLSDNPFLAPFFDRYAKELHLKRKRTSGLTVVPPQDVAPSKGLARGFKGPCKPVNRSTGTGTEIRKQVQGSGNRRSGSRDQRSERAPAQSRRQTHAVENHATGAVIHGFTETPHPGDVQALVRDREGTVAVGSVDVVTGLDGAREVPSRRIGFHVSGADGHPQPGDGGRGACVGEGARMPAAEPVTATTPATPVDSATRAADTTATGQAGLDTAADADRELSGRDLLTHTIERLKHTLAQQPSPSSRASRRRR